MGPVMVEDGDGHGLDGVGHDWGMMISVMVGDSLACMPRVGGQCRMWNSGQGADLM